MKKLDIEYEDGSEETVEVPSVTREEEEQAKALMKNLFPGLAAEIDAAPPPIGGYFDEENK